MEKNLNTFSFLAELMATKHDNQVVRENFGVTNQQDWHIDLAEVQNLADVLRSSTKRRLYITFYRKDLIFLERDIAIKDDMSNLSILLTPLYAVVLLYGQDPSKIQFEKFNIKPYCGCHFCCRIILPLGHSVAEVWLGRVYPEDPVYNVVIIKGKSYERYNILRAVKYYFFTRYNYREYEHYEVNLDGWMRIYDTERRILMEEMRLCEKIGQDKNKILRWILRGKSIPIPGRC